MIVVSVTPRRLVVGQRARVDIRFSNVSTGPCRNIVFTLEVPSGLRLIGGGDRIHIAAIGPDTEVVRSVLVEATQAGDYRLTSPNFSYRDEDDDSVRNRDWLVVLTAVEPAPVMQPVERPAPRLRVEWAGGALEIGQYGDLLVFVQNASAVPVTDVAVMIDGPIDVNGNRGRIATLPAGKKAKLRFNVKPTDGGLVRVSVRLSFSYPGGHGSLRQTSQLEHLRVLVITKAHAAGAACQDGSREPATILFLAASPRDLEPLRPDAELRLIEQELLLSPNRDKFKLVAQVAVRLEDISRALAWHRPQIVHFSGHGDDLGRICVEDPLGNSKPVEFEGLAKAFGAYDDTIQLVLINACHSKRLAEAVSSHINHVIGMRYRIADNAARMFSVFFYQAIFGGANVARAFKVAPALLESDEETVTEYEVPVLYSRNIE